MKLEAEGVAGAERLHRKIVAFGKELGACGQLKALAMPVIDLLRPVRTKRMARRGWADRVVADLGASLRMRRHACAELNRQHLRTEADAQERALLAQPNFDPVDLPANVIIGVIGAHRAAEKDRAGMLVERLGQRIAKARPADIEVMTERTERVADAARRR